MGPFHLDVIIWSAMKRDRNRDYEKENPNLAQFVTLGRQQPFNIQIRNLLNCVSIRQTIKFGSSDIKRFSYLSDLHLQGEEGEIIYF